MIGVNVSLKPTFSTRKLKTNDPRVVHKYLSTLNKILLDHNIYEGTNKLLYSMSSPMTQAHQAEYEEINKIKIEAMEESEKHSRKLKMGAIGWCSKLQRACDKIQ